MIILWKKDSGEFYSAEIKDDIFTARLFPLIQANGTPLKPEQLNTLWAKEPPKPDTKPAVMAGETTLTTKKHWWSR